MPAQHISDKAGKDHCYYQKTASSPSAIQQCPRQTPAGDHTLQIRYQLDAVLEPYTAFYSRVKQASHRYTTTSTKYQEEVTRSPKSASLCDKKPTKQAKRL